MYDNFTAAIVCIISSGDLKVKITRFVQKRLQILPAFLAEYALKFCLSLLVQTYISHALDILSCLSFSSVSARAACKHQNNSYHDSCRDQAHY